MHAVTRVAALLVVGALAVACSSGQHASGQTSGHTGRSPAAAGPARVSACDLVTAADVQNMLGQDLGAGELTDNMHTTSTPLDAVEGSDTMNGTCSWVTTGMYVRVSVAAPGHWTTSSSPRRSPQASTTGASSAPAT